MTKKFAPFHPRPNMNPKIFDPNQQTFVPDRSLDDSKIRSVSVRRVQMLGAKVYNSATQSIASNSNYHSLTPDTRVFDEGNLWRSGDPTKLTMPFGGIWTVSAFASFSPDATNERGLQLLKNGATQLMRVVQPFPSSGTQATMLVISDFSFDKGDYVEAQVQQNRGSALDVAAGEDDNFFSAVFRGPV